MGTEQDAPPHGQNGDRVSRPRVAVIGAGLAGCAATIALAEEGIDAVAFEKGQPSKDKPCGDAFIEEATKVLAHFGLDTATLEELGGVPFRSLQIENEKRDVPVLPATGWVVPRAIIDQKLRDIAAEESRIVYGSKITAVSTMSSGCSVIVETDGKREQAEFDGLVIASGSAGPLSRTLGIDGQPRTGAAVSQYGRDSHPDMLLFRFGQQYGTGYGWIFPAGSEAVNFGCCRLSEGPPRNLRKLLEDFTADFALDGQGPVRGGIAKLWSGQGTTWHDPSGVVSCGDAAGLIDPANGEGITAALLSGLQAGRSLAEFLGGGRVTACLEGYSNWVREYFGQRYQGRSAQFWLSQHCVHKENGPR